MDSADALKALEKDWKSGLLSIRLLRIKHGLSEDIILSLAEKHSWGERTGNLHAQIRKGTAQAIIDQHAAESQPSSPNGSLIDEQGQVSAYTKMVAGVIRGHQVGISRGRALGETMMDELAALQPPKVDQAAIDNLAMIVAKTDPEFAQHLLQHIGPTSPQQQMAFLGNRIKMLETLSVAHERYIKLERKALMLDDRPAGEGAEFDDVVDEARERLLGG